MVKSTLWVAKSCISILVLGVIITLLLKKSHLCLCRSWATPIYLGIYFGMNNPGIQELNTSAPSVRDNYFISLCSTSKHISYFKNSNRKPYQRKIFPCKSKESIRKQISCDRFGYLMYHWEVPRSWGNKHITKFIQNRIV